MDSGPVGRSRYRRFSRPAISTNVIMRSPYQFRVLDEVGGVADRTRDQDLSGQRVYVAADFVFMLVTDVPAPSILSRNF